MRVGELRPEIFKTSGDTKSFLVGASAREKEALEWMLESFEGHFRDDGVTPFSDHCVAVASILRSMGCDEDTVVAGLLHDLAEDHPEQGGLPEIVRRFGDNVAFLVNGVSMFSTEGKTGTDFEALQKIVRESGLDLRVSLIKLADRLHNLLTLGAKPPEKQKKKAEETLRVYVPLAKSLGMWTFASALADLALPYVDREAYEQIKREIDADPRLEPMYVSGWIQRLGEVLDKNKIKGGVGVVVGGYYEMSEKRRRSVMYEGGSPKSFSDITDLLSFRVVVDDDEDVYKVAGLIWKEFASLVDHARTDDLVSHPANNGYRAIQMTLEDKFGPIEVALATRSMEDFNRNGIMAASSTGSGFEPVMVFTPKGELMVFLPKTTALDLAYSVSWNLGLNADYVLINGKKENLSYVLKAGDLVEIVPVEKERQKPRMSWLSFANDTTRKYIQEQLKTIETGELQRAGRLTLEKGLMNIGMINVQDLPVQFQNRLLMRIHCQDVDQLYIKLAIRPTYLPEVIVKIKDIVEEFKLHNGYKDLSTIAIRGEGDRGGLSAELSIIISGLGGSIISNREKTDGKVFSIRRFVHGLDEKSKEKLRKRISGIEEFKEVIVV